MTARRLLRSCQGLFVLEAVVAAAFLAVVGVLIARLLLNTTRTLRDTASAERAMALGGLALQQYTSYAVENFALLGTHNVTMAEPKTFFGTPDNLGYDDMKLTTNATYDAAFSSCSVNVRVWWGAGSQTKSVLVTKNFSERTPLSPGGVVDFSVKACSASNCPGISGCKITLPGYAPGDPAVYGITDALGHVQIRKVLIGTNVSALVEAPKGSSYFVPTSHPAFVQGWFYQVAPGVYSSSVTVQVAVPEGSPMAITISSFTPAGVIRGYITNTYPGGPVSNVELTVSSGVIFSTYAYAPGGMFNCTSNRWNCWMQSKSDGSYEFANVLPNLSSITIVGIGGSQWPFKPGDIGFYYRYLASYPYSIVMPLASGGVAPVLTKNLAMSRMGTVTLNLKKPDGTAVAVSSVTVGECYTVPCVAQERLTDGQGSIRVYNVCSQNHPNQFSAGFNYMAYRPPTGGDHGYYAQGFYNCPTTAPYGMDMDNVVNITMTPGHLVSGTLVDLSNQPVQGAVLKRQPSNFYGRVISTSTPTNALGQFTMDGFYKPETTNPTMYTVAAQLTSGVTMHVNISGSVRDSIRSEGIPNFPVIMYAYAPFNAPFTPDVGTSSRTNSSGNFNLVGNVMPTYLNADGNLNCAVSPCSVTFQLVNSLQVYLSVSPEATSLMWPTVWPTPPMLSHNVTITNQNFVVTLNNYRVRGRVTDSYGTPLQWIWVQSSPTSGASETDANGYYKTLCPVMGRSTSNPGTVQVYVRGDQASYGYGNGIYETYTSLLNVPSPLSPDPLTGFVQDIILLPPSGGGGM